MNYTLEARCEKTPTTKEQDMLGHYLAGYAFRFSGGGEHDRELDRSGRLVNVRNDIGVVLTVEYDMNCVAVNVEGADQVIPFNSRLFLENGLPEYLSVLNPKISLLTPSTQGCP